MPFASLNLHYIHNTFLISSYCHFFSKFPLLFIFQQDISRAADDAAAEYHRTTPPENISPEGVWDAMALATDTMVKAIKAKDFLKYLAVANPKNGEAFFDEVNSLFSLSFFLSITLHSWFSLSRSY